MKRILFKMSVLVPMLIGLPALGVFLAGGDMSAYLEFPPRTRYVGHAPFSWTVFSAYTLFVVLVLSPFLYRVLRRKENARASAPTRRPFPSWGWFGVILGLGAWVIAWSRFPWVGHLQSHTFTPLWIAYIITVNALTHRRTGRCMLLEKPGRFLLLFPTSALFWWFFEYLNRFVQNWVYSGTHFSAWEYFWYATLPFSTVLPAVIGTRELLLSFSWPRKRFGDFFILRPPCPRGIAGIVLLAAGTGLACIGIRPNLLFPLLWVSPLLILVSLQALFGEEHIFTPVGRGDWSLIAASAAAALACGFFWEMWNFFSLARWQYNVPFVNRFHVFEMPILGYAGYLPFGLECAVIADLISSRGSFSADVI
ncbi:MAG: hypothetical protein JW821_11415 [Deltaproteobacteria bacterium]|nr:hypothetical protein [Deltaproteobacteria bacterium]